MNTNKLIIGILLLALGLRLINLNQSFWLDEATSGLVVRDLSISQIIKVFSPGDFHPPLYYLTLKLWNDIFGNSEVALRSMSLLFGLGCVYMAYRVGGIFGRKAGLLSAFLLAVNGLHIHYSQEARMYMMSVFAVLMLVFLFMKTLTSKKTAVWFFFCLFLTVNAFTDYLPNLILVVFWVYAVFKVRNKTWWKFFLLSHIPLLVFGILWLPYFTKQIGLGLSVRNEGGMWWSVLGKTDLKNVLLIPVKFIFGRISFYNKAFYFALSAIILSIYSLIVYKGLNKKLLFNKFYLLTLFWFSLPLVLSAVMGFKISVFSYFRLIFCLPVFLIILSLSILNLDKKRQKIAIIVVSLVSIFSSLYYIFTPRFHREDWRSMSFYIEKESVGYNSAVVFASDGQTEGLRYYSDKIIIESTKLDNSFDKIWYVRYVQDIFDPGDSVAAKIGNLGYKIGKVHDFNGIIVWEYENSN